MRGACLAKGARFPLLLARSKESRGREEEGGAGKGREETGEGGAGGEGGEERGEGERERERRGARPHTQTHTLSLTRAHTRCMQAPVIVVQMPIVEQFRLMLGVGYL